MQPLGDWTIRELSKMFFLRSRNEKSLPHKIDARQSAVIKHAAIAGNPIVCVGIGRYGLISRNGCALNPKQLIAALECDMVSQLIGRRETDIATECHLASLVGRKKSVPPRRIDNFKSICSGVAVESGLGRAVDVKWSPILPELDRRADLPTEETIVRREVKMGRRS